MKRVLLYGAALLFIAWSLTSCEALNDCKLCRLVSTDSSTGDVIDGPESEYCGAELLVIEAKRPVVVGTVTTKYTCR